MAMLTHPAPWRPRFRAYLQLMRVPNLFTAMADILAGYFVAAPAGPRPASLALLLFASAALYTGGIVLNDFFDYATDCAERPQRPLPSGRIRRRTALGLGLGLLALGWTCAAAAGRLSGLIALVLVGLILSYDALTKNIFGLGSLNMGACRFFNFLLGMSLVPVDATRLLVPLLTLGYVIAITSLSKGEVRGGSRLPALRALAILAGVIVWFILLIQWRILPNPAALPALGLAALIFFRPTVVALWRPEAPQIGRAVKFLVLGLIPLNATIALGATDGLHGLAVLLLLAPALWLAKYVYVT